MFTARYGLISYINQITFSLWKAKACNKQGVRFVTRAFIVCAQHTATTLTLKQSEGREPAGKYYFVNFCFTFVQIL